MGMGEDVQILNYNNLLNNIQFGRVIPFSVGALSKGQQQNNCHNKLSSIKRKKKCIKSI